MKRVLLNKLLENFEHQIIDNVGIQAPDNIRINSFSIHMTTFNELKENVLNALKQLKSKMKTLTK
jgi:hypothetical protein